MGTMALDESTFGMPDAGALVDGKYELVRRLSEGAGGVVWEADDPQRGPVALKILKWSPLKSRKVAAERFKNEFAILKSLAHPNISQIYDFGLDAASDAYFFTSELLTAGDLKTMIGAPIETLEELLLQALRALEYLRGHKLLHLDIKPQNLLLRHDGEHPQLAMIDFGLAAFRPPDRPGGTANYMPPEIVARRLADEVASSALPPPDHRSDLYSLGVTFYFCFTGEHPFCVRTPDGKRVDAMATLKQHLTHEPPPPSAYRSEIPPYLDRIIMKLMAREPEERYPSAIVAAQALQYRSPLQHAPESAQTLLSYLPKEGKMVDRRRELATIEELLRGIAEGTPHAVPAVAITGARGVGRSRLLGAARPLAQQLEMTTISLDGAEADEATLADVLEHLDEAAHGRSLALLIDDADLLASNSTGLHALRPIVRRLRMQQKLTRGEGARLFVGLAFNTDRCDLEEALLELRLDEHVCRQVPLRNFTRSEIAEYLAALLGEAPDAAVIEQLEHCTEGNPLFLTEHLEQMIAQGRLFSLAGRPDARTLKTIGVDFSTSIPSRSMAESVLGRIAQLPQAARTVAALLACWHRAASADEVCATSDAEGAGAQLVALVSAGLVGRVDEEGRFGFTNALAGRIIREHLPPERRARHHDTIASYLGGHGVTDEGILYHLAYGSVPDVRRRALEQLADAALAHHVPLEAAQHMEAFLAIVPETHRNDRAWALRMLGQAFERAGRARDARKAYERIAQLAAADPLRSRFAAMSAECLGLLSLRERQLADARRHFTRAIAAAERAQLPLPVRMRLENGLAGVELRDGEVEEAVARYRRTAALEEELSERERAQVTNNELGEALLRAGAIDEAIGILERELERAEHEGDPARTAERHYLLGNAFRNARRREFEAAQRHYHEGLQLAREHRLIKLQVRIVNGLGNLHLKTGRQDEAMAHYREGLKLAQQIDSETTSVELMIGLGLAAQQAHDPEETIEYFEAALDFASGPKGRAAGLLRRYLPTIYVSLGDAYFQKHDFERAEEYLHEAEELDHQEPLSPDIRYSLYGTVVEICLERHDVEAARRHLPILEAIAKAFPPARDHFQSLAKRVH